MKKILKALLTIFIFCSTFLYASFIEVEDEHHHVHAYSVGDTYGDCPICSTTLATAPIYGSVKVVRVAEATCIYEGTVYVSCETAGCNYSNSFTIAALGHNYTNYTETRSATCTQGGIRVGTCSRCGAQDSQSTSALGHNYTTSITTQATCTESGVETTRCTRCGDSSTRIISPLGHSYVTNVTKQATCTESGIETSTCSRCGDSKSQTIAALGHNYVTKITKQATCTEAGIKTTSCTRCNYSSTSSIKALGHDYEEEIVEATCTTDGSKTSTCKRCKDTKKETIKALGHDLDDYKIIKEATCEEDGEKEATCKRCNELVKEKIAKLGHSYPDEWKIEKEASYFDTGLESKTCSKCNNIIQQEIPKKNPTPLIIGGGAIATILGGALLIAKKGYFGLKTVNDVAKRTLKPFKPSIEDKGIVVSSEDQRIIDLLKSKPFLKVKTSEFDSLKETVEENEPDMIISSISNKKQLDEIISLKKDNWEDTLVGLLIDEKIIKKNKNKLDNLVNDKQIVNYLPSDANSYNIFVKMVIHALKPDLKSDESLENIGKVADAFGIPGVSAVIDTFIAGREIKDTLQEGDLGVTEKATIISDIASILGFDTVSEVAGLIDDVEDIKNVFNSEAGAYEAKEGYSAVKDVSEVISDVMNNN